MARDPAARKTVLAVMAAILDGRPEDAGLLLGSLDRGRQTAVLVEAVAVAADLAARLAGSPGVRMTPVDQDVELHVLGESVRRALGGRS